MIFSALIWITVVVGIVAIVMWQFYSRAVDHAASKREAMVQFETWQASMAAAQCRLGPGQGEVLKEAETVGRTNFGLMYSYTLTLFLRNLDGEHFIFKSTPNGPYIKPISDEAAKVVLKEGYVSSRHEERQVQQSQRE